MGRQRGDKPGWCVRFRTYCAACVHQSGTMLILCRSDRMRCVLLPMPSCVAASRTATDFPISPPPEMSPCAEAQHRIRRIASVSPQGPAQDLCDVLRRARAGVACGDPGAFVGVITYHHYAKQTLWRSRRSSVCRSPRRSRRSPAALRADAPAAAAAS